MITRSTLITVYGLIVDFLEDISPTHALCEMITNNTGLQIWILLKPTRFNDICEGMMHARVLCGCVAISACIAVQRVPHADGHTLEHFKKCKIEFRQITVGIDARELDDCGCGILGDHLYPDIYSSKI